MLFNCHGQAGPALELLAAESPAIICMVEVWLAAGEPLPAVEGYNRTFALPRPDGRGGVACLLADWLPVEASLWRSRAADGMLWVQLSSLLPGSEALMLAVAYMPPQGSGGCPAEPLVWWQVLAAEWAEAEAHGLQLLAGDLNARTACWPDWPPGDEGWAPRCSTDLVQPNSHGMDLLWFCQTTSGRLCNGRVAGSSSGAATSFGVSGAGQAVVDYFVASANLFPHLLQLLVWQNHPAADLSDHAVLQLSIAAAVRQQEQPWLPLWPPEAGPPLHPPRQFRYDPERVEDAVVAAGELCGELDAIAAAADAASSQDDVDGVAAWFNAAVCRALEAAHMREMVWGGSKQQSQQRPRRQLPRHVRRRFGLTEARKDKRQAVSKVRTTAHRCGRRLTAAEVTELGLASARTALRRKLTAAYKAAEQLRGELLEQRALVDTSFLYQ